MNKLDCDKDGCKRLVYYVEWACDGMEYAFCKIHGDEFLINEQYPNRIKSLRSRIRETSKQVKCQNSIEGHVYPPKLKPKPQKIWDAQNPGAFQFDVASGDTLEYSTWTGAAPKICKKCGFRLHEERNHINMLGNDMMHLGKIEWKINQVTTKDSMGMIPA